MRTNFQLKHLAKQALRGAWGQPILAVLIYFGLIWAINIILSLIQLISSLLASYSAHSSATACASVAGITVGYIYTSIILGIVILPFAASLIWVFYKRFRDTKYNMCRGLFRECFSSFSRYLRLLGGMLLMEVYVFLWTCLFIVPGIIMSLAFALTPFILFEHPELSCGQAVKLSRLMMKGKKGKLFGLYLSFIGWAILCVFTMGIGFIVLLPYIYMSLAAFYEDVKEDYYGHEVKVKEVVYDVVEEDAIPVEHESSEDKDECSCGCSDNE